MSPASTTCHKKFNLINILQHCPSDFVTEAPLATRATFWFHNPCNIRKMCGVASAGKNVPRLARELSRTDKHLWSDFMLPWRFQIVAKKNFNSIDNVQNKFLRETDFFLQKTVRVLEQKRAFALSCGKSHFDIVFVQILNTRNQKSPK